MDAPFVLTGAIASPRSRESMDWWPDGALVVDQKGSFAYVGQRDSLPEQYHALPQQQIDGLIFPGFIDAHVHLPQLDCRGKFGETLMEWLHDFIYPAEQRFENENIARNTAQRFFRALIETGTTTAMVFGTSHERATHIAFEEAEHCGLRIIMGSMLMDRNAPQALCVEASQAQYAMERLIERWHLATPLLRYAVSPRFAPACSPELLRMAGDTARRHSLHVQTHFNESPGEIASVRALFPEAESYADVYEASGLLGPNTILGHSVHTDVRQLQQIAATSTAVAHCPDSNLFLGSGRFPLEAHLEHGIRIALGSDVGAGTTLSMLSVMRSMSHAQGKSLHPFLPLYHATLGAAEALGLDNETGSLTAGKSADLITISLSPEPGANEAFISGNPIDIASALLYSTSEEHIQRLWVRGKELTPSAPTHG